MTTTESTKDDSSLDLVLTRYVDSRDGYTKAAELADQAHLSAAFSEIASNREKIAIRIAALQGRRIQEILEGTVEAVAHRWWMGLRDALSQDELHGILAECVRGEKVLAIALRDALKKGDLEQDERELLEEALEDIQTAIRHFEMATNASE